MRYAFGSILASVFAASAFAAEPAKNPAVTASNAFAWDLFRQLDTKEPGKNLFLSPYSISTALAMTMEGAKGETAGEMGTVLRLPADLKKDDKTAPWNTEAYSKAFAELQRKMMPAEDVAKAEEARKKIAELKKTLEAANKEIAEAEKQGKFPGEKLKAANELAAKINEMSKQIDQYELRVANALFGEKTYPFRKEYLDSVNRSFGSGAIRNADFINDFPTERAKINRWVEEQTKERIKDLIPEMRPEEAKLVRLILVNAIYFKGEWSLPFEEKSTKEEKFSLTTGATTPVKMMNQFNGEARYAAFDFEGKLFNTPREVPFGGGDKLYPDENGFRIAEIPVKGKRIAMTLIAPQRADGLAALEKKITGENLTAWLGKLQARPVQVALPRFKLETEYSLADALKNLGMKKAFDEGQADFTGMTDSKDFEHRLHISKVIHKAFVEVNEKGAEAAAATAVIMAAPTSVPATQPFHPEFRADRPFLFLIRDTDTGAILFLGRYTEPVK